MVANLICFLFWLVFVKQTAPDRFVSMDVCQQQIYASYSSSRFSWNCFPRLFWAWFSPQQGPLFVCTLVMNSTVYAAHKKWQAYYSVKGKKVKTKTLCTLWTYLYMLAWSQSFLRLTDFTAFAVSWHFHDATFRFEIILTFSPILHRWSVDVFIVFNLQSGSHEHKTWVHTKKCFAIF